MATTPRRRPPRPPQIGDELLLYGGVWHVAEVAGDGKWLRLQWAEAIDDADSDRAWLDFAAWRDLQAAVMGEDDED